MGRRCSWCIMSHVSWFMYNTFCNKTDLHHTMPLDMDINTFQFQINCTHESLDWRIFDFFFILGTRPVDQGFPSPLYLEFLFATLSLSPSSSYQATYTSLLCKVSFASQQVNSQQSTLTFFARSSWTPLHPSLAWCKHIQPSWEREFEFIEY